MTKTGRLSRGDTRGRTFTQTALFCGTLILAIAGAALIAQGANLSRFTSQSPLSARLDSIYVFQGYIVGGITLEVAALTLMAMQSRAGRVALAASSISFLNLAFLWTSRGPGDTLLVNLIISNFVIAFVGVGVDTGIGVAVVDLVFLAAIAVAFISVFLLSTGGRLKALSNSLLVVSTLTLILSLEVYLWDRGELNLHFTSLSPAWFTNLTLALSSVLVLFAAVALRILVRFGRRV